MEKEIIMKDKQARFDIKELEKRFEALEDEVETLYNGYDTLSGAVIDYTNDNDNENP